MTKMPPAGYPAFLQYLQSGRVRKKQASAALLITGLQQRLLSSIEAFARTLRVHRRTVEKHWHEGADQAIATRAGINNTRALRRGHRQRR